MPDNRNYDYIETHGRCAYCGCYVNELDFCYSIIKPIVYALACPDCTNLKGDDDLEQFRTRLENLNRESVDARLALKYDPLTGGDDDAKYHHRHEVVFYFEKLKSAKRDL